MRNGLHISAGRFLHQSPLLSSPTSLLRFLMNSVTVQFPQIVGSLQKPETRFSPNPFLSSLSRKNPTKIHSGLRGGPRKPLWKSRVMSTESMQAVQSLKLSKSNKQLATADKLSRLLKADLLDTLTELKRQNECELAHLVFDYIRNEIWYKPDLSLYCDMILMFGKSGMVTHAEQLFDEMEREKLVPDTRSYSEMIGVYLKVGDVEKAMEMYGVMKESGCVPDKLTLTILIRNLEKAGEDELVLLVKKDCAQYVEYPEKFLEQVAKQYPKRLSLGLV